MKELHKLDKQKELKQLAKNKISSKDIMKELYKLDKQKKLRNLKKL